jgi:hypothetical protein
VSFARALDASTVKSADLTDPVDLAERNKKLRAGRAFLAVACQCKIVGI